MTVVPRMVEKVYDAIYKRGTEAGGLKSKIFLWSIKVAEKYKVGAGIILDVIDAELALSQARLNYASAQYDYARYKANLEYVIGTPKGETIDG